MTKLPVKRKKVTTKLPARIPSTLLASAPAAMQALMKLRAEIANAPTLEAVERIRRDIAQVQADHRGGRSSRRNSGRC
jgi:hypothetical protein